MDYGVLSIYWADRHFESTSDAEIDSRCRAMVEAEHVLSTYSADRSSDSTQTLRNAMESLDTGGNPGQQVRRHLKKNLEMAP
jgi:hypothetical protein